MPLLTLDYFLPEDVYGDDPQTAIIEPSELFSLGVRVRNDGWGGANKYFNWIKQSQMSFWVVMNRSS